MTKTEELLVLISEKNPLHGKYLNKFFIELLPNEKIELENIIEFFIIKKNSLQIQADAYLQFLNDIMMEQKYFVENGHYRYSRFAQVADNVYYNNNYMEKYMLGLTLSHYLWINHLQISRWFSMHMKVLSGDTYLEVGPGYGEYFFKAITLSNFKNYNAIDLSQTSVDGTIAYVKHFLPSSNKKYKVTLQDFFDYNELKKVDAFIMGEVLEHVENPLSFLTKIKSITHSTSFIYIATVINAPAIDHISLFRSKEEIFSLINQAGLSVKEYLCTTANQIVLEKAEKRGAPITIALVLKH